MNSLPNGYSENEVSENHGLSIILMIGDGMGFEHVKLARWVEVGKEGLLNMETLPVSMNVTTHNYNQQITDSAAAATAIATGEKTNNTMVSFDHNGQKIETILEYAAEIGKSTGIVTTTEITHGTPAAFYSHVSSRYNDSEIMRQLVEEGNVDVVMGGGRELFSESQILSMQRKGYAIIENRSELIHTQNDKILGLFSAADMPYERFRDRENTPSLSELTKKSIEVLSQDPDGFFLMVEGGKIDWAAHAGNAQNTAIETIEFDKSVEIAMNYAQIHDNLLLIVTADHETTDLTVISESLSDNLPINDTDEEQNEQLRKLRTNQIHVTWSNFMHTSSNVPLYGIGSDITDNNKTIVDNTEIFNFMKNHFESDVKPPVILIESPENKTYSTNRIWMNISLSETASWLGYSLNNQENVTLHNKSISLKLLEGNYQLKIFTNDSMGNLGKVSVNFTIKLTETTPFPFLSTIALLSIFIRRRFHKKGMI
jgi:alkaline phosphatase